MARISMSLQLGPMVKIDIHGESCTEITTALQGFEQLNKTVDAMFSDLATRVFPDVGPEPKQNATRKNG